MPFVYTAASLLSKDPKTGEAVPWDPSPQRWIDGSVDNDIPMTRLAELFNVNHFIVSQVNPHVRPFLPKDNKPIGQEDLHSSAPTPAQGWRDNLSQLAKSEALHRMRTLAELGLFPNVLGKTVSVLSQKYSGDITIFPEISYADIPRILSNPTPEFMHAAMLSGLRATWPKLSVIKNHCAIELALDDAVQKLRTRVVFSDEELSTRMAESQKRRSLEVNPRGGRSRASGRRLAAVAVGSGALPGRVVKGHTPTLSVDRSHVLRPTSSFSQQRLRSMNNHMVSAHSSATLHISRPSTADAAAETTSTTQDSPTPNQPSKHVHDVTSSGADETSNLSQSSSSTSLDLSSPTESPSSPAKYSTKWARSLFGSNSQPSTPSPMTEALSMTLSVPAYKVSSSTSIATERQTLGGAVSPEPRFKRLFKGPGQGMTAATTSSSSKITAAAATPTKLSNKERPRLQRRNWGLEIDIPATAKGFVNRGKGKKKKGSTSDDAEAT